MYQKIVNIHDRTMMVTISPSYEVRADGYNIIGRGPSESEALTDFSKQLAMLPPIMESLLPVAAGGRVIHMGINQRLGVDDEVL